MRSLKTAERATHPFPHHIASLLTCGGDGRPSAGRAFQEGRCSGSRSGDKEHTGEDPMRNLGYLKSEFLTLQFIPFLLLVKGKHQQIKQR